MLSDKRKKLSGGISALFIGQSAEQLRIPDFANVPATRRKFIAGLLAGAGSLALTACGGGGGSSSGTAVANTAAKAKAQSESAQETVMPPATSIIDSGGNTWTLVNGAVYQGGVNTYCPVVAVYVMYWNQTVYCENEYASWYVYGANGWTATTDPRIAAAQVAVSKFPLFYGMNGHMAWPTGVYSTMTAAQQLAILQNLGVTNYRADVAGSGMAQTVANALAGAFKNSGVSILPCINPTAYDQTATEAAAYSLGYDLAVSIATPLKGLVSYIECGNELEANGLISSGAGDSPADYNPAYWPAYRGVLRGMIDGVKSVDSTILCGINVGVALAYGGLQMLWNGQTPNGTATPTSGATPLQWDIMMYHWYQSSGDITRAGPQGLTNVLQILQQSFNLPIWLTEWGYELSDTSSEQSSYVTSTLGEYYSLRETYNLQSVMMYELIDMSSTDTYGLIEADGVTHKPCYASFEAFTAANTP